jgi:hypothetical protein
MLGVSTLDPNYAALQKAYDESKYPLDIQLSDCLRPCGGPIYHHLLCSPECYRLHSVAVNLLNIKFATLDTIEPRLCEYSMDDQAYRDRLKAEKIDRLWGSYVSCKHKVDRRMYFYYRWEKKCAKVRDEGIDKVIEEFAG